MKELVSYQMEFRKSLKTNQILKLYKMINNNDYQIYLHQDHLIADAGHLPKLLSFFLFFNLDQPMLLIIDGINAEQAFRNIENYWEDNITSTSCRKKYSEGMITGASSISV